MLLRNYLRLFRQAIEKLENHGYTEFVQIKEEIRPNKQAIIKAKIVLVDSSVLYIKVSYAYQYQDRNGDLIIRYDNAVHRPAPAFKDHKHTKDGVIVEATLHDISEIVDELAGYL